MMGECSIFFLNEPLIVSNFLMSEAKFTAFCTYSSSEVATHSLCPRALRMLEPIFPTPGRFEKVINGFKGFVTKELHEKCDENLLYYRIEPASNKKIDFSLRELAKKSPDTLFLIENTPIKKVVKNDYQIYQDCFNNHTLVLFDHNKLNDALSYIPNSKLNLNIYFFTLDLEVEITDELKKLESKYNLKIDKFPLKMSSPKF